MKVGSAWVVGRESSKQPPWSIAMSTRMLPLFIRETRSLVTSFGALAPGISTAPITRSASMQAFSSSKVLETTVWIFVPKTRSASRSLLMSLSSRVTWKPMPTAICAALQPETPPPMTTARPAGTPGDRRRAARRGLPPPARIRW
ncbi:hypothetical protein SHIRM173S_12974 [Streptomyces hirsutus]